ncbi:MAG: hypothetical protein Q8R89_06125 [Desulfomicrobium sp.]|nr:hypothetical protein [Desulfomicrobium sp.]
MVAAFPLDASAAKSLTDEERSLLKLLHNARSNIPDIARIMEKSKVEGLPGSERMNRFSSRTTRPFSMSCL